MPTPQGSGNNACGLRNYKRRPFVPVLFAQASNVTWEQTLVIIHPIQFSAMK